MFFNFVNRKLFQQLRIYKTFAQAKRSSFVAYADERAEKALAATIRMIKSMGMTVLAEGVEERFNLVKRLNY